MKPAELQQLSDEELTKKEASLKSFSGVFIGLLIVMFGIVALEYFREGEVNLPFLTITICTVGGFFSVYDDLKKVRAEQRGRK